MKKLFTIILCCLCAQITLLSQIIYSGRVISSEDKAPIPLANIVLLAQDSSFIAGGVTTSSGVIRSRRSKGKSRSGYERRASAMRIYCDLSAATLGKLRSSS